MFLFLNHIDSSDLLFILFFVCLCAKAVAHTITKLRGCPKNHRPSYVLFVPHTPHSRRVRNYHTTPMTLPTTTQNTQNILTLSAGCCLFIFYFYRDPKTATKKQKNFFCNRDAMLASRLYIRCIRLVCCDEFLFFAWIAFRRPNQRGARRVKNK